MENDIFTTCQSPCQSTPSIGPSPPRVAMGPVRRPGDFGLHALVDCDVGIGTLGRGVLN
jgi:hypothetical protein